MNRRMPRPGQSPMASKKISVVNIAEGPEPAKEEYTLMSALERIVISSRESGLEEDKLNQASIAMDFVCSKIGITQIQAIMFAICVDQSFDPAITLMDIRRWIECPMISLLKYQQELDALVEKGLLMPGADTNGLKCYAVPRHIVDGLNRNDLSVSDKTGNLDFDDFFEKLGEYFRLRRQGWDYPQLAHHINVLTSSNLHLAYCKKIKEFSAIDDKALVLLHYFCHRLVNHNDPTITEDRVCGILETRKDLVSILRDFIKERHPLVKLGLVELATDDGLAGNQAFFLTNKARQSLLVEADVELVEDAQTICQNELVPTVKIKAKDLFYSEKVGQQIGRLQSLLDDKNYQEICSRLEQQGMRKGFACLFYGAPGTGKTESVLQLARMTGRDIMQVDISEMRSKWVGESQKLVKSMFDRYRKAVRNSKKAPILLFNEADAILTKRNSSAEGSVDKMENAMQNIFLQEIENLEGILIATTNLSTNLDSAFERRFIYKVEFELPDADCRAKIWKSMISDLSDSEASLLATKYDFSGGQIENVSRKQIVDTILYGEEAATTSTLIDYCDTEYINNATHKPVGFCV